MQHVTLTGAEWIKNILSTERETPARCTTTSLCTHDQTPTSVRRGLLCSSPQMLNDIVNILMQETFTRSLAQLQLWFGGSQTDTVWSVITFYIGWNAAYTGGHTHTHTSRRSLLLIRALDRLEEVRYSRVALIMQLGCMNWGISIKITHQGIHYQTLAALSTGITHWLQNVTQQTLL